MKTDVAQALESFSAGFGATSTGQCRLINEDSFVCQNEQGIWLVADGVGGNAGGQLASQMVCDELPALLLAGTSPRGAIAMLHLKVKQAGMVENGASGMATTLVMATQNGQDMEICWVGDSRAYVYENAELWQVTKDHSLIQGLRDMGLTALSDTYAAVTKNVLTKCVGSRNIDILNADCVTVRLSAKQKLLLCSDGLTNELEDTEIGRIIAGAATSAEAIEQLIQAANLCGGADNITAVLIDAPAGSGVS